ncbi:MAG: DUF4131 domain-containing protein [Acidobacteria bacterium]|nr:DUF4131 domain-containing protein [Acidobacteriota bacterium]MYJ03669.1 DUF4131 domain-containing protein [Acidobacteriota bacterium]
MIRPAAPLAFALLTGGGIAAIPGALPEVWFHPLVGLAAGALLAAGGFLQVDRAPRVTLLLVMAGTLMAGAAAGIGARGEMRPSLLDWFEGRGGPDPSQTPEGTSVVEGRLVGDAAPTTYGGSLTVAVSQIRHDGRWRPLEGVVRLSVGGELVSDHIALWRNGRMIRAPATLRQPARYANPGTPDGLDRLYARGIHLIGSVKSALLVNVLAPAVPLEEWGARMRAAVRHSINATVGTYDLQSAAIVTAVLIGDRAGLDPEMTDRLQRAGTYHVIAISGGNIAILTALLLLLLRLAGLAGRLPAVIVIVSLLAYGQVVASEPSVTRALFVAIVVLAAQAVDQRADPINTLTLAAGGLTLVDPRAPFNPGFQLTFGATAGLLIGVPRMMAWLGAQWPSADQSNAGDVPPASGSNRSRLSTGSRYLAAAVVGLLVATICAELALFPVAVLHFSRVTLAGLLLNFAAIPLMTATQMAGMAAVGLHASGLVGAAALAGWTAHLASAGIVESARFADWAPALSWRLPPPWLPIVGGYYIGWIVWLSGDARWWQRWLGRGMVTASAVVMLAAPFPGWPGAPAGDACGLLGDGVGQPADRRFLRVHMLDVDQADATLVRFPNGQTLLVDAAGDVLQGPFDIGARIVVPAIWALGVRSLDYLAITHGDPDHAGGGVAVVRDLRPGEVWEGVPVPSSEILAGLRAAAEEEGALWRTVRAGDRITMGDIGLHVLHPPAPDWERRRVRNDDSIVIELRHGEVSIVLPGDIGEEVEPTVAAALVPAALRILKAPHHGSRSSSSAAFIQALDPSLAVVSAGRRNLFGHPHPDVLARYERAGVEVLQTGYDGAVALCTDGDRVGVSTVRGRRFTLSAP